MLTDRFRDGKRRRSREGTALTRTDRYVAFLLSTLPKLAATRLYRPGWKLPMRRFAVLDRALRAARPLPGIALEFGVYRGRSLRHAARRQPARTFFGFDSFRGLPPDGRPDWQIDFATALPPQLPANCRLVPGWFAETIPAFLHEEKSDIALVTVDCDVYSSAREVLFGLGERLRPGTILYFDELINYDTFLWNEMLALFEFLEATGLGVEWIGAHCRVRTLPEVFQCYDAEWYPPWQADVAAGYGRPAAAILTAGNSDLGLLQSPAEAARIAALAERFDRFTERYRAL
jgi:methyltransferase family protein